jgi:hypothetical protein
LLASLLLSDERDLFHAPASDEAAYSVFESLFEPLNINNELVSDFRLFKQWREFEKAKQFLAHMSSQNAT